MIRKKKTSLKARHGLGRDFAGRSDRVSINAPITRRPLRPGVHLRSSILCSFPESPSRTADGGKSERGPKRGRLRYITITVRTCLFF
jgi:hypothetical protein